MEWVLGGIVVAMLVAVFVVATGQQRRRVGSATFTIDEHHKRRNASDTGMGGVTG